MKRSWLLLFVVLILASAVWYSYYKMSFSHLFINDAMDYASIGHNVARGEGFVSSYITPLGLANKEGLPHPNLWRAPLWPAVLALFIKVFGTTDQAVAIAAGSFFIAGAGLVFLLGKELSGRLVGFGAAVVFIFSAQNLVNSVSGMTETVSVFMMLLAVYLLVASWSKNRWGDFLAGGALGLFYLTRYNALLFVPFFTLFLLYHRNQSKPHYMWRPGIQMNLWPGLRYLLAFSLVVSPWLIRNYKLTGSPLFSLQKFEPAMFTETYPGYTMYMMLDKINVVDFISNNPHEIWHKVILGWHEFTGGFLGAGTTGVSPYLFWLFLFSLFMPISYFLKNRGKGLRILLISCFAVQLAALLVIHFIHRLFFIFTPFYILLGVAFLIWLLNFLADRLPVRRNAFIGLFTAIFLGVFIFTNLPSWSPLKAEEMPITVLRESVKGVTDMSTHQDLIISNDGHLLAWYGDRYAAKLPYSVEMIPQMERLAPLKFIYLSSRISWNIPEADESWKEIYWSRPKELYDFYLACVFPDGSLVYRKH